MSARNHQPGERRTAVAGRLTELLLARSAYRRQWQRHTVRYRSQQVNRAAVARVLARYLLRTGRGSAGDEALLARRLKDLVGRALGGAVLSPGTLELFVEAFAMSPADAEELLVLLGADGAAPSPRTPPPDGLPDQLPGPARTDRYRTMTLHEVHALGPDGRGVLHRTVHVIRAVHLLAGYPYLLDAGGVRLEVLRGGRAGPPYPVGRRLAVDIEFHRPLRPGETGSFEYVCHFDPVAGPVRRFRRGTAGRLENVELQLRFAPDRPPERVWWAVWPDPFTDRPARQEPVRLDPDGTVRRFVETVEGQSVGFRWRFPG